MSALGGQFRQFQLTAEVSSRRHTKFHSASSSDLRSDGICHSTDLAVDMQRTGDLILPFKALPHYFCPNRAACPLAWNSWTM
jgi:hypothetical protein